MSTSNRPIPIPRYHPSRRSPPRLRMVEIPGRDRLDGGWWPYSRDLAVELSELVDRIPLRFGRAFRALVSPAGWEPAPLVIRDRGGDLEVVSCPALDPHVIHFTTSLWPLLRVLVVPPGLTQDQGGRALLAAATRGNAQSARDLLDEVIENPDVEPLDLWADDGDQWWGNHPVAPSFRTDR